MLVSFLCLFPMSLLEWSIIFKVLLIFNQIAFDYILIINSINLCYIFWIKQFYQICVCQIFVLQLFTTSGFLDKLFVFPMLFPYLQTNWSLALPHSAQHRKGQVSSLSNHFVQPPCNLSRPHPDLNLYLIFRVFLWPPSLGHVL